MKNVINPIFIIMLAIASISNNAMARVVDDSGHDAGSGGGHEATEHREPSSREQEFEIAGDMISDIKDGMHPVAAAIKAVLTPIRTGCSASPEGCKN